MNSDLVQYEIQCKQNKHISSSSEVVGMVSNGRQTTEKTNTQRSKQTDKQQLSLTLNPDL